MNRNILPAIVTAAVIAAAQAQDRAAALTPAEIEARKASVANLEAHIKQREERLAEWGRDIVALDRRISERVDHWVKMLANLRDSQESRTQVTQLKKESIEALRAGIQRYVQKRREIRELVREGDTSALPDLSKFDARILKGIDQIAELTKSIPTHEDVEKYQSTGSGDYWNGYYYETTRISEEWKQNRRDTNQSDQVREQTITALREGLQRLDQRRRTLKDSLANRLLTDSARALYTTELGQIDAYEDHLNKQLADVTTSTDEAGTRAVGRDQLHDIANLIEDERRDIREDVAQLFRTYDQFVRGRAYLEGLKENLAARKAWLEKHAKEN